MAVTDIWSRADSSGPWRFQLMRDDGEDGIWRSRRCSSVSKPLDELQSAKSTDTPFLTPEVQLFYKAKAPRPKDRLDFQAALPKLSRSQRMWLHEAIATAYGPKNEWLEVLERATSPAMG